MICEQPDCTSKDCALLAASSLLVAGMRTKRMTQSPSVIGARKRMSSRDAHLGPRNRFREAALRLEQIGAEVDVGRRVA